MRDHVNRVLAAAAAEGRQDPPPVDELARYGHAPVPPTLRCQDCGQRLQLVDDPAGGTRWGHVAGEGDDW